VKPNKDFIIKGTSIISGINYYVPYYCRYFVQEWTDIPLTPPPNDYFGLSLEEIRNKYGKDAAQHVYNHAAMGLGDLTKEKPTLPCFEPIKKAEVADWEFSAKFKESTYQYKYSITLLPSPHHKKRRGEKPIELESGYFCPHIMSDFPDVIMSWMSNWKLDNLWEPIEERE